VYPNSNDSVNTTNVPADQSVVSEISKRGSQDGRSFGRRGAYNIRLVEASGACTVQAIILSAWRSSPKQYQPKETIPGNIGFNKIDNHANTTSAGLNWHLIELSGKYCTVSPFSAQYLPFLRSVNRIQMSRLQNAPQRTHAPQLAIRSSWSLTKCCGLAMTYIFHL
jgi:hypothetical protein